MTIRRDLKILLINHHSFYVKSFFIAAAVLCIVLGLASRRFEELLPPFLALHAGDALWAMMVYFGFRGLLPEKCKCIALGFAFLFCLSIETSQLYQADWINGLRSTVLGSLVLGHGFLFADLFRYVAGIFTAVGLEKFLLPKFSLLINCSRPSAKQNRLQ